MAVDKEAIICLSRVYSYYFKGAPYRIWCGVNRLGDCGVKVVGIDSAILQLLLSRLVIYC